MNDNTEVKKDRTITSPMVVLGVGMFVVIILFSWMKIDFNKRTENLKTEITYQSNIMLMISSGEFIEYCGIKQAYYDTESKVIWIMSNGSDTQAFVLYNIDGTLRTYDGNNEFPLVQLEKLGNYMYIYYDKVTNIKYLINMKTNFGTPMLNADGTYEVVQ